MTKVYVPTIATRIPRRRARKLLASGMFGVATIAGLSVVALSACDSDSAPTCSKDAGAGISASGTNGTCRFSPSFQNAAGQPYVYVDCLDGVTGVWVHGPGINIAKRTDDTFAQCSTYPHPIAALVPKSKHS